MAWSTGRSASWGCVIGRNCPGFFGFAIKQLGLDRARRSPIYLSRHNIFLSWPMFSAAVAVAPLMQLWNSSKQGPLRPCRPSTSSINRTTIIALIRELLSCLVVYAWPKWASAPRYLVETVFGRTYLLKFSNLFISLSQVGGYYWTSFLPPCLWERTDYIEWGTPVLTTCCPSVLLYQTGTGTPTYGNHLLPSR